MTNNNSRDYFSRLLDSFLSALKTFPLKLAIMTGLSLLLGILSVLKVYNELLDKGYNFIIAIVEAIYISGWQTIQTIQTSLYDILSGAVAFEPINYFSIGVVIIVSLVSLYFFYQPSSFLVNVFDGSASDTVGTIEKIMVTLLLFTGFMIYANASDDVQSIFVEQPDDFSEINEIIEETQNKTNSSLVNSINMLTGESG